MDQGSGVSEEKKYPVSPTLATDAGLRGRFNDLVAAVESIRDQQKEHCKWTNNSIAFLDDKIRASTTASVALTEAYRIDAGYRLAIITEVLVKNLPPAEADRIAGILEIKMNELPPIEKLIEKCLVQAEKEFGEVEKENQDDSTGEYKIEEHKGHERGGVSRPGKPGVDADSDHPGGKLQGG
jgi:hypothetical protein